ncbi:hypothetical protein QYM36_003706 [Artemia franciscana]|uniref:Uncharacterized protein n=1 Tax=Artemia franciscana TaxID=6661 RepID=A0AA88IGL6_ARTSF|nr:hypothetical protein QYM36_003706 [Artemia franciscana]
MASYLFKVGRNIKALIEERFEEGTYEKYLPLPIDPSLLSQRIDTLEVIECEREQKWRRMIGPGNICLLRVVQACYNRKPKLSK